VETTKRNVERQKHRNYYDDDCWNSKTPAAKIRTESKSECENKHDANGQKSELQEQHRSNQPDLNANPDGLTQRNLLRLVCHGVCNCA